MKKLPEIIIYVCYKVVFDCTYIFFTTKQFEYMQKILTFNSHRYIINWLVFFVFLLLIIFTFRNGYMAFITRVLFILSALPSISYYGLKDMTNRAFILIILYWLIMYISLYIVQNIGITTNKSILKNPGDNTRVINIIFAFSLLVTVTLSGIYADFRLLTSLSNIYFYRFEIRELQIPAIARYLMVWAGNVLLPYCFAVYLNNKKYLRATISVFLGIMLFSINGLKTWLFVYVPILFIYLVYSKGSKTTRYSNLMAVFATIFGATGLSCYLKFDFIDFASYFDRIFAAPSFISYNYYSFFVANEPLMLRESILRFFLESPYQGGVSRIIGPLFGGHSTSNANNGLFGDAFANFKELGVLLYPVIISIVFKIFVSFAKSKDARLVLSFSIILIWNIINASLFNWLLSGGVIILLAIFKFEEIKLRYRFSN